MNMEAPRMYTGNSYSVYPSITLNKLMINIAKEKPHNEDAGTIFWCGLKARIRVMAKNSTTRYCAGTNGNNTAMSITNIKKTVCVLFTESIDIDTTG